jgi:hypothetical protein
VCCVFVCFSLLSISHKIIGDSLSEFFFNICWKNDDGSVEDTGNSGCVEIPSVASISKFRKKKVFRTIERKFDSIAESHLKVIVVFAHIFPFHFAHSHMASLTLNFCAFVLLRCAPGTTFDNNGPNAETLRISKVIYNKPPNCQFFDGENLDVAFVVVAPKPKPTQGQKMGGLFRDFILFEKATFE